MKSAKLKETSDEWSGSAWLPGHTAEDSHGRWKDLAIVFFLGLLVRIIFIHAYPPIYGGDATMRLMNTDKVVIAYQLPLLQVLLYLTTLVCSEPLILRYLMSLLGAAAGVAFYLLSHTLWGRKVAFASSLFFIFNPFVLVHSIVPYQEILMLLTLCLGLYHLLQPQSTQRLWKASLFLGLACLTRYEAWIVTAVAALHQVWTQFRSPSTSSHFNSLLKSALCFGWAPLLWILMWRGLSPPGTFVLERFSEMGRLQRIPYVLGMTFYHAGPALLLLAIPGLTELRRQSVWKTPGLRIFCSSALLLLLLLNFTLGVPPDTARYVTDREAHWLILAVFWAAAIGLLKIKQGFENAPRAAGQPALHFQWATTVYFTLLAAALAWGLYDTQRRIEYLIAHSNLKMNYDIARYLEEHLPEGARALVFAQPLPASAIQEYLDQVYSKNGQEGVESARKLVADMSTRPLDYSRIVVNTHLGKDRILASSRLQGVPQEDFLIFLRSNRISTAVVFSDFDSDDPQEKALEAFIRQVGRRTLMFSRPNTEVWIYEIGGRE